LAELLGILRPDTDDDPVFILAQATPGTRNASKAHAHLQKKIRHQRHPRWLKGKMIPRVGS